MRKDKLLAAAQKQQQRGSLSKAQALLNQAAAVDPQDSRTWMTLAEVCNRLQDNAGAILAYEKAAHLLRKQGFVRRAIAVYKNILALAPEKVQTRIDAATASAEIGLLADAIHQYETVVSALLLEGNAKLAVTVLLQWRTIDKNNLVVLLTLAEASLQAGLEQEGQDLLAHAAERFLEERNFDEYVRVSERLLTLEPNNLALRKSLARVYLGTDRSEHALARLAPCCAPSTDDAEVLSMLAQAFEARGQIDKSVTVLRALGEVPTNELVKDVPGVFDTTFKVSITNDDPPALMRVENLPPLSVPPPSTDVDHLMGDCKVLMELMVERLTRVLAIEPSHVEAREKLAYVLSQLGRAPAAVEHLTWFSEQARVTASWSPRVSEVSPLLPAR